MDGRLEIMSEENVKKAIWTIWGAISLAYATYQYEAPIKELYAIAKEAMINGKLIDQEEKGDTVCDTD